MYCDFTYTSVRKHGWPDIYEVTLIESLQKKVVIRKCALWQMRAYINEVRDRQQKRDVTMLHWKYIEISAKNREAYIALSNIMLALDWSYNVFADDLYVKLYL